MTSHIVKGALCVGVAVAGFLMQPSQANAVCTGRETAATDQLHSAGALTVECERARDD